MNKDYTKHIPKDLVPLFKDIVDRILVEGLRDATNLVDRPIPLRLLSPEKSRKTKTCLMDELALVFIEGVDDEMHRLLRQSKGEEK